MASDSEDEDFARFGTPLDPLDEDAIPKKKPFTLEDQVVRDKQGRRRFHGAFTGGFSAGFFNSVGSLEGWTPSQFKSSRGAKAQPHKQKAEDFMDEEDMDEFGIAPKVLQTTSDYSTEKKGSRKRTMMYHDGPIPGEPVLRNILEPVRETVGVTLLMKMGWKPGQGIGPRVSKTEKKKIQKRHTKAGVKIYGCSLPSQQEKENVTGGESSDNEDDDGSDNEYYSITFAPDDYEPYIVKPKDNYFGIGYSGLDRRPVLSSHIDLFGPSLVMQDKKKKLSVRGQAFGVGALEEEDEDIYSKEDMSQYDFALECSSTLAERRKQEQNKSRLALQQTPSSSDPLEGFVLATVTIVRKKFFPPPQLPPKFEPQHKIKKSRFEEKTISETQQNKKGPYNYNLTANERAVLVNEISPENKKITEEDILQNKSMTATKNQDVIERTSCGIFKPFAGDPDKQERYEKYLSLKKLGQTEKLNSLQPLNMTEWECEREKTEFEQAARLFKPLSAEFSDRFVSASQPDDATDPLVAVQRTTDANTEMVNAAKMKMFGRLTREIIDWDPSSLLYRRFNIAEPNARAGTSKSSMNQRPSRPKFSVFNFLECAPFNVHASVSAHEQTEPSPKQEIDNCSTRMEEEANTTETEKQTASVENSETDLVPEDAPKIDLYKAIFLSSSEDEADDEKDNTNNNEDSNKGTTEDNSVKQTVSESSESSSKFSLQPRVSQLNVLRNTSPPRGVFANLDLDAINSRTKKVEDNNKTLTEIDKPKIAENEKPNITENAKPEIMETEKPKITENKNESDLMYGPSLPTVFPDKNNLLNTASKSQSSINADSDNEWIELKSETKHKHKKKHSKKSHKKDKKHKDKDVKKHKHKKKKK